jgi:hypothetical protein
VSEADNGKTKLQSGTTRLPPVVPLQ